MKTKYTTLHIRCNRVNRQKNMVCILIIGVVIVLLYIFPLFTIQYAVTLNDEMNNIKTPNIDLYLKKLCNITNLNEDTFENIITIISNIFNSNKKALNFIQIGANDGNYTASNDFIQKLAFNKSTNHWYGIMVEPSPVAYNKLAKTVNVSRMKPILGAFGLNSTQNNTFLPFYMMNIDKIKQDCGEIFDQIPHWYLYQVNGFDMNKVWKLLKNKFWIKQWKCLWNGFKKNKNIDYVQKIYVNIFNGYDILNIWNQFNPNKNNNIHIFVTDTEGFDYYIVPHFLKINGFKPYVIIYEQKTIQKTKQQHVLNKLKRFGYKYLQYGGDVLAFLNKCDPI